MILYDKNSIFLGMGQSELSMLGYEDMEEFKSNFNDFADLFVNHPGYISKFKNFSWIDYVLHSGAPNKNILIKHKNGTEIEAKITISEVLLINEINKSSSMYSIEISATMASADYNIKTDIDFSNLEEKINENMEIDKVSEKQPKEKIEQNEIIQTFEDILAEDQNKIVADADEKNVENIHLKITDDENKNIEDDFKLHIEDDYDINSELNIKDTSASIATDDDKPIKLKVVFDENEDEISENLQTTPTALENHEADIVFSAEQEPIKDNFSEEEVEYENIDFMGIAEDTGMDLGDIAEIIEDFIHESEDYIKKTNKDILDIDFIKNEAIKLKGIASNLKISKITNTLNLILENSDNGKEKALLQSFQKQIKNLEEQLS